MAIIPIEGSCVGASRRLQQRFCFVLKGSSLGVASEELLVDFPLLA